MLELQWWTKKTEGGVFEAGGRGGGSMCAADLLMSSRACSVSSNEGTRRVSAAGFDFEELVGDLPLAGANSFLLSTFN